MQPTEQEFAELFRASWPRLYRLAYAVSGDRAAAEDDLRTPSRRSTPSGRESAAPITPRPTCGLAGLCGAGSFVVAVSGGVSVMTSEEPGRGLDTTGSIALGDLDFSQGARAYADPGRELHLAGRTFPADGLPFLDTDAVATSYGIVFYRAGRPMLLAADGRGHPLVAGDVDAGDGFRPTAKADSVHPWVAYATRRGTTVTVTVHDLRTGEDVATTTIDGADGTWQTVYDGGGRVVDVRGGVMLYDGKPPADLGLSRVQAPIEATLTFDGKHVLDWSSRLRSTDGGPDLVLDQGPTGKGLGFWAIDSDGSVLVARPEGKYPNYLVYDCDAGSGVCDEPGPLRTTGGEPEFIGVT